MPAWVNPLMPECFHRAVARMERELGRDFDPGSLVDGYLMAAYAREEQNGTAFLLELRAAAYERYKAALVSARAASPDAPSNPTDDERFELAVEERVRLRLEQFFETEMDWDGSDLRRSLNTDFERRITPLVRKSFTKPEGE